jgi:hypothetical protein
MMPSSIDSSKLKLKFLIFLKKCYKFLSVGILIKDPMSTKRFLAHSYLYDLEMMCKKPQKKEDYLFFMNFGMKKFIV